MMFSYTFLMIHMFSFLFYLTDDSFEFMEECVQTTVSEDASSRNMWSSEEVSPASTVSSENTGSIHVDSSEGVSSSDTMPVEEFSSSDMQNLDADQIAFYEHVRAHLWVPQEESSSEESWSEETLDYTEQEEWGVFETEVRIYL